MLSHNCTWSYKYVHKYVHKLGLNWAKLSSVGLIEKVWFGIFFLYILNNLLNRFYLIDSVLYIWFGKFGYIDLVWYIEFGKLG